MINKMDLHLWLCHTFSLRLTLKQCYDYKLNPDSNIYGEKIFWFSARSIWYKGDKPYFCKELIPEINIFELERKLSDLGL